MIRTNKFNDLLSKDSYFVWFLVLICIFHVVHTFLFVNHPFIGQNAWRDAQTFGVARNYIEEAGSFLQPRYDIRFSDDGRLPGEFPLQSYYCALFMKLTAKTLFFARLSNMLLGLATALLLFFVAKKIGGKVAGLVAITSYLSNPLANSQMISVMPETMVNLLCILALLCYFYLSNSLSKWVAVVLVISICTMVKPSGYVIVVAILLYDYFKNGYSKQSLLAYLFVLVVPLVCLKGWIAYTLQFESPSFVYPITHHYVRTLKIAIADFNFEVVSSAFEKTFLYSFNILGILGLIVVSYLLSKRENRNWNSQNGWLLACLAWCGGGIAFLFYAGEIQKVQMYYATPLILPAILLTCNALAMKGIVRGLVGVCILLQTNVKINTFKGNYLESGVSWESMRLEKVTDTFSTRKDPFIVYPYAMPDFTVLGRLGRRGANAESIEIFEARNPYFKYVCLTDTARRLDILPYVVAKPITHYAGMEFYRLR